MKFAILCFAAATLLATSNINAQQQNRFWPDDIDKQHSRNASNSAPRMGNCTREQEYEYVRRGYTIAEINRLCGLQSPEQEDTYNSSIIVPERTVKPGSVIDLFKDGKVTITIGNITLDNQNKSRMYLSVQRPGRKDYKPNRYKAYNLTGGNYVGQQIKFDYRRQLFQLRILDIFFDDQTAKISVQHVGDAPRN